MSLKPEIWELVKAAAKTHGMDPFLLAAQVLHESAGDPSAIRYEPGYKWTYPPPKAGLPRIIYPIAPCSKDTEAVTQRISWGLLQVMGAVARELGFKGPFLAELARDPEFGLRLGATWMRKKLDRYANIEDALAAFNAGTPSPEIVKRYAKPIIRKAEELRRAGGPATVRA